MGHFLVTGNSILTKRFFNRKRDMTGLEICVVGWAGWRGDGLEPWLSLAKPWVSLCHRAASQRLSLR